MFERFTERARHVVVLAQDEARTLKHNYIGTEHMLLGLLREEEGLAARVLDILDITIEEVRLQVARIVGQGDKVPTGQIPFTPRAQKVLELALREALSLKHNYVGDEHILLGLVRENEGVGARILLDFDADAETIRNEIIGMLSGPSRRDRAPTSTRRVSISTEPGEEGSIATQRYEEPPPLRVGCPHCATVIETVTTEQRNRHFEVAMQGDHTCPGCGQRWAISVTAAWTDPSPPADPEDDFPSEMAVWRATQPAHFSMSCFRCDQALVRITLDQTATSPLHVEAEGDRTCPSCAKPWRISYSVSWEEQPFTSSARAGSSGVGLDDAFEEVRCALMVFSDSLHPDEITTRVGVMPSETRPRGTPRKGAQGRTVVNNQWIWRPPESTKRVLNDQLQEIRAALGSKADAFRVLAADHDVQLDIAIYHHGTTLRLGWAIDPRQVELAAAFGAAVNVDEYDYTTGDGSAS